MTADEQTEADPAWSADGKLLAFGHQESEPKGTCINVFNLQTRSISQLPGSQGIFASRWSRDGRYIAGLSYDNLKLVLFDVQTQRWRQLAEVTLGYLAWSADSQYLYFDTPFEKNPAYMRVRIRDGKMEQVVDMKRLRTFPSQFGPGSWSGLAPGDVPLFVRDTSSQEVYALELQRQ